MLRIKGTYQNGSVRLDSNPTIKLPVKVVVSFPEIDTPEETTSKILKWNDFSFEKSRQFLKDLKSSLSEEVISERRHSITYRGKVEKSGNKYEPIPGGFS